MPSVPPLVSRMGSVKNGSLCIGPLGTGVLWSFRSGNDDRTHRDRVRCPYADRPTTPNLAQMRTVIVRRSGWRTVDKHDLNADERMRPTAQKDAAVKGHPTPMLL